MYDISILHDAMLERGLTVLGLAQKAKKPESTVRQIFKKQRGHPKSIKAIARALGLELKDLMPSKKRGRVA